MSEKENVIWKIYIDGEKIETPSVTLECSYNMDKNETTIEICIDREMSDSRSVFYSDISKTLTGCEQYADFLKKPANCFEPKESGSRTCETCKHNEKTSYEQPCYECMRNPKTIHIDRYEPREEYCTCERANYFKDESTMEGFYVCQFCGKKMKVKREDDDE